MEIKFRGKSKLNGKWHFGSYINFGDDWCQIITTKVHDDGIPYDSIRVISDSVGLFTGIHDKNNVDIYHGDIIKINGVEGLCQIMYYKRYASFCVVNRKQIQNIGCYELNDIPFTLEIVGNIYDNPELLEVS